MKQGKIFLHSVEVSENQKLQESKHIWFRFIKQQ